MRVRLAFMDPLPYSRNDRDSIAILLVEDCATDRTLATLCLENGLGDGLELYTADTLQSAMDRISQSRLDLILLDLHLPDSEGLDTLRHVLRVDPDATVVVISGESEESSAISAVRLGAQDFIVKGTQLTDRHLIRSIRLAMERAAHRSMEAELLEIRHQMHMAHQIQKRLLPGRLFGCTKYSMAGGCQPANENGGDYFDFMRLPDGSSCVVIGDVSGHGIGPSMVMIETRASIRALVMTGMEIGEVLTEVNRLLINDLKHNAFVTLFMVHLDPTGRRCAYSSAGHPGYLVRNDGASLVLSSPNPPLGIVSDERYLSMNLDDLRGDDLLVMFTDGITEATRDHETFLGVAPVLKTVVANRHRSADYVVDQVFELAARVEPESCQHDDRTAVVIKRLADAVPRPHFQSPADSIHSDYRMPPPPH
ncbi:PP2C family protein-serine/threonine phosphatase [Crateriforma spongiae]|uniref:PP2C family protein-serine/threonine phosphatase n=1 Tax=Crateriforma spongiae TaxID=2724528 RepID=UPI0014464D4A|nr:PP2C family protein-serine/threonine phosphatase [Crateriforma spongiae]